MRAIKTFCKNHLIQCIWFPRNDKLFVFHFVLVIFAKSCAWHQTAMIKRTSRLTGTWHLNELWIPLASLFILISDCGPTEAVRRGNIGKFIRAIFRCKSKWKKPIGLSNYFIADCFVFPFDELIIQVVYMSTSSVFKESSTVSMVSRIHYVCFIFWFCLNVITKLYCVVSIFLLLRQMMSLESVLVEMKAI